MKKRMSQYETYAWLCTAIICHVGVGIEFTPYSKRLIQKIRNKPDAFNKALEKMQKPDEFGIVELEPAHFDEVNKFMFGQ